MTADCDRITVGAGSGGVMASRRAALRALGGLLLAPAWIVGARASAAGLVPLDAPRRMAAIHVTASAELLAVSVDGELWRFAGRRWTRLGANLDPGAPIASGHGRAAGRGPQGRLWVLEDGRVSVSRELVLAPHAGLQMLAFGIIAVSSDRDGRSFAVRLEPAAGAGWVETARGADPVLPDARPLQVNLDGPGSAEDGHIAVLAGPDDRRYRHGALGDETEATQLLYLERHSLARLAGLTLPAPYVFEDLAPRAIAWRGGSALLTVRSGTLGAQLAVVAKGSGGRDVLHFAGLGTPLGTANRWMAPITDGERLLAVHTPHIGGVLHEYRSEGDALAAQRRVAGVSNHALGQRELDLAAWIGPLLLLPAQDRRQLRLYDPAADWSERARLTMDSPVVATRSLRLEGRPGCALLSANGTIAWASPPP